MQTTLIYNPQAGIGPHPGPEEILESLRMAGHEPIYHPTTTESDLDQALAEAKELVVIAGGDGSIRAVATRLLGKDIKITPLPLGTANNIARILALTGNPLEIIAGLSDPVERKLDIGRIITPQGSAYFLEAMGVGMFADILKSYKPEMGKSISRGVQTIFDILKDYQPKFIHVNLDGEDLSGSYLLLEVMNTPTMGLRFMLAPEAKPDDGLFDLVLIHAKQRENYLEYMAGVLTGKLEHSPAVSVQRGKQLEIAWRGFPFHFDAEVFSGMEGTDEKVISNKEETINSLDVAGPYLQVALDPNTIRFWIPRVTQE